LIILINNYKKQMNKENVEEPQIETPPLEVDEAAQEAVIPQEETLHEDGAEDEALEEAREQVDQAGS